MDTKDKVYRVLRAHWTSYGRAPTQHELLVRTGRSLDAIRAALVELREEGYVDWEPRGGEKSIRLTNKVPRDEFREERSGSGIEYWTDH